MVTQEAHAVPSARLPLARRRFAVLPFLAAEAFGEPNAILFQYAQRGDTASTREDEEKWARKLRALGRMWSEALPDLLAKSQPAQPEH